MCKLPPMFKVNIIETDAYYKLRNLLFWLNQLFFIAVMVSLFLGEKSVQEHFVIITIYLAVIVGFFILNKKMKAISSQKKMEADVSEVRIKDQKGKTLETIRLDDIDKLIAQEEYKIRGGSIKDMLKEWKGKSNKNFFTLHTADQVHKFDFVLDSQYAASQLNKLIKQWQDNGFVVETEG